MKVPLLVRASLRHFARHPVQTLLAVLGVALGLAVVVAIETANRSAIEAFRLSSESVAGRSTHQIVGDAMGVPESLYRDLRLEIGRAAAPIVEVHVRAAARPDSGLRLLGVDPFSEAGFRSHLGVVGLPDVDLAGFLTRRGALVASPIARDFDLAPGDRLVLSTSTGHHALDVLGVLGDEHDERRATADLVLVDVSTAQEVTGMIGRLSRIDLVIPSGSRREPTLAAVRRLLPTGLEIVRPESRSAAAEEMTRAFRLNLRALSLLGLLCGAFLIYNTMTFAVVQRRSLLGILRTLGVTRGEIFSLVLAEAMVIGLAGSILGATTGRLLAEILIGRVTQTINDLYFALSVSQIDAPPQTLVVAVAAGVAATVLAAVGPAAEATAAEPRASLDRSLLEGRVHRAVPTVAATGLVLTAGGTAALMLPGQTLAAGFAGLFLVLVGLTLLSPAGTLILMRLLSPLAGWIFGGLGRVATRGVSAALSRTAIAVAALMMAVSVTVGVEIMIRSFRITVEIWLTQVLPADLYVTSPAALSDRFSSAPATLDADLLERLRNLDGVMAVDTVRHADVASSLGPIRLLAYELSARGRDGFVFRHGRAEAAWTAVTSGRGSIVTEPLATRYRLEVGDRFELVSSAGPLELEVAGVIYDYASERGRCIIDQHLFSRLWSDENRTAASLWLAPGRNPEPIAAAARQTAGDRGIVVRSNGELRAESMRIFDRTFLITGVLRILAIIVALIAVLSALTALQLERARELAVLRASGLTPGQVWTLVTSQTGLMGLTAGLFSLPVGLVMAVILIHVINRRSFGWSLEMSLTPQPLLTAVGLAVGAALVAGLYPAWRMARVPPAEALRDE